MPLEDILVHVAVPLRTVGDGDWIEGEREERIVEGVPVECAFFPPGSRERGPRSRVSDTPLLLTGPEDFVGARISLSGGDRVRLSGEGLDARWFGEWMLDGDPQQLGKPGEEPVAYQVQLRRITD